MTSDGYTKKGICFVADKGGDWEVIRSQAFAKRSLQSQPMRKHLYFYDSCRDEKVFRESTVTVRGSNRDMFTTQIWENQYTKLQQLAPVLVGILEACIPKHSSRKQCIMASCIAILVKSYSRL